MDYTANHLKLAVLTATRDWLLILNEQNAEPLAVKSLLLGCEQRLCEMLDLPRTKTPIQIDRSKFGIGRECGDRAYEMLKSLTGPKARDCETGARAAASAAPAGLR